MLELTVSHFLIRQIFRDTVQACTNGKNHPMIEIPVADKSGWQFWVDRGGTFTDIVARRPNGSFTTHKILSDNPEAYDDAALQGIRDIMGLARRSRLPAEEIDSIKMGTTVATNALLERKGDRTLLVVTRGFRDQLRIAYQARPNLFDQHIVLPEMLYERVEEVTERIDAKNNILTPIDIDEVMPKLQVAFDNGIRSIAIVFMHGYRVTKHEVVVAELAHKIGFTQISTSHGTSPMIKFVGRGDTTVVDAYLSPILRRYVNKLETNLGKGIHTKLQMMQSNGGLTDAGFFKGKDAILSGPAGGVVGAVKTASQAGFDKVITFDMGGTSTDVSHYQGQYERVFDTVVAGVRIHAPMLLIHTVAAGGGSLCQFKNGRFQVGPESAGANPGPACYRRGGPLTVTDCNVMLGKLQPIFFPSVFGANQNEHLDIVPVKIKLNSVMAEVGKISNVNLSLESIASGFLKVAVENMANAIKKISVQRGYDATEYALQCFGGAGGQHACLIADVLGMKTVLIHPFAGVLSAYGMGLAEVTALREKTIEVALSSNVLKWLQGELNHLIQIAEMELHSQGITPKQIKTCCYVHVRYEGSDTALQILFGDVVSIQKAFDLAYQLRFGFLMSNKSLVVAMVSVVATGHTFDLESCQLSTGFGEPEPDDVVSVYMDKNYIDAPVYQRAKILAGQLVKGPALVIEATGTNVIEAGWEAEMTALGNLVLRRVLALKQRVAIGANCDPIMLEVFNNLFMSTAEQMGYTLQNAALSVNVKERLDFSCAIFDTTGALIANAPHMPVHLGSMGESVKAVIRDNDAAISPGDAYALNDPYNGGTHLPDITVVTPVFEPGGSNRILFFVASRGHHPDIGGVTPGSAPPNSKHIVEEGVLINNFKLVDKGTFRESEMIEVLTSARYPARNPEQNIADLRAQLAANEKGVSELLKVVAHYGIETVTVYMGYVQDNAEESVRRVIHNLNAGSFIYPMDNGQQVEVAISIDKSQRSAVVDFSGTSPQSSNNFNAPAAVCRAAILYVFRTLVDENIPMNEGCLKPVNIILPDNCMLNAKYPAAVIAGNVETSQIVTDTLYGALGVMAAAQGTMNNFFYGNNTYQYYETLCGGSGAGADFDGTDAVHTHMTNSRLTDPEVLEWRYPVLLESFEIRQGSGGSGLHSGGNGVRRRLRFMKGMEAVILANHRIVPPYGMNGGDAGAVGRNWVERSDGKIEEFGGTELRKMEPGDVFVIETPGGGGFGKALNKVL